MEGLRAGRRGRAGGEEEGRGKKELSTRPCCRQPLRPARHGRRRRTPKAVVRRPGQGRCQGHDGCGELRGPISPTGVSGRAVGVSRVLAFLAAARPRPFGCAPAAAGTTLRRQRASRSKPWSARTDRAYYRPVGGRWGRARPSEAPDRRRRLACQKPWPRSRLPSDTHHHRGRRDDQAGPTPASGLPATYVGRLDAREQQ